MSAAFPLQWPEGWPRTHTLDRSRGWQFKQGGGQEVGKQLVTLDLSRKLLLEELVRLGAGNVVLSSNVPLRSDGQPRSDAARFSTSDPGVAIYFTDRRGRQMAMASDQFDNPAANTRSLGLAIEAMRQLERHGGGAMMERAFTGFAALPPPKSCWEILGLQPGASAEAIKSQFRKKAIAAHPDTGGNNIDMGELIRARDAALKGEAA